MDEVADDEGRRPPLPWEVVVAVGCLLLLSFQAAHEGYLYCTGQSAPGAGRTHSAWTILLVIYVAIGFGLLSRSPTAWWFAMVLIGGIAFLFLFDSWDSLRWTFSPESPELSEMRTRWRLRGARRMDPDELAWILGRNVLLTAVPVLLLLGAVRQQFRHR